MSDCTLHELCQYIGSLRFGSHVCMHTRLSHFAELAKYFQSSKLYRPLQLTNIQGPSNCCTNRFSPKATPNINIL